MRKGFTLLELIVVIIIIGILATLGFMQYTSVVEKGRKAEARTNLGTLRMLEIAFYEDTPVSGGAYGAIGALASGLPTAAPGCGDANYYYGYSCAAGTGVCTATRCTSGGKPPQGDGHTITITPAGALGGTGAWQ